MCIETGFTSSGLVMIGNYCRKAAFAYLRNHSTAKVREYDQIGPNIGNLVYCRLIKLAEKFGLIVQAASLQSSADDSCCREPISIHVRDDEEILFGLDDLCRAPT